MLDETLPLPFVLAMIVEKGSVWLSILMLFRGGILYLVFQDIAAGAHLRHLLILAAVVPALTISRRI